MSSIEEWQARGQYKTLCGRRIFVLDDHPDQPGDTLLLIHGFPTSSWDWQKIWPVLTVRYRVVSLDLLGYGFSEKPPGHQYNIAEQADIVEACIERLGLTRFHVLAHDYGNTVAQELLARQNAGQGRGSWQSVCFLNGGLFPETHRAALVQKLLAGPLGPLLAKAMSERSFARTFSKIFGPNTQASAEEIRGFWALANLENGRFAFPKLISYMRERREQRPRWVGALQESKVPIGLINGSVDPISGAHMIDRYLEVVGEPAHLTRLDNIGHYPQVEAPDRVAQSYLDFLAKLSKD